MLKDWEIIEQCWLSEQISPERLLKHFNDDSAFHEWFHKRATGRLNEHGDASQELRTHGGQDQSESRSIPGELAQPDRSPERLA